MSKVALIGATGFVGSHLLQELLDRGYEVIAIARHTDKIAVNHPRLTISEGDVYDSNTVASLVSGADAVISAFNAGWTNPNIYPDFIAGSKAIEAGVAQAGVKKLIVVGGAGSLSVNGQQLVDGPGFPAAFKAGATAARDYLNVLKANTVLDWEFISPAIFMSSDDPGARTGKYRSSDDGAPVFDQNGVSKISVFDLAVAIVDELENEKYVRKHFTVAY